ncbi:MAG: signal peptidase II [Chloroflexota bacterium]
MQRVALWWQTIWPVLLVAAVVIGLDQWTKIWVRATIPKGVYNFMTPIPQLGEYFVFEHVDNYGAAFGILQNQGNLFVAIAAVVVVAILVYVRYLPMDQRLVRFLLGLQLGGAVGNVIDRLYQGFVTDFIKMGIPGVYYWPNYNIADSAIVSGVIGLGIFIVWDDLRQQRENKAAEAAEPA